MEILLNMLDFRENTENFYVTMVKLSKKKALKSQSQRKKD